MTKEERKEKHYDKIDIKWNKLKPMVMYCPNCFKRDVSLNESFTRKIRRFFIECESCHWCSNSYPTIKMTIRHWNRMEAPANQIYIGDKTCFMK